MATILPAEQYDQDFIPHRLCNWERPADNKKTKAADPLLHTMRPRSNRTEFIANDRGYLETSKVRKLGNSFNHQPKVYEGSPAQWPKRNPCINSGSSATMGYKGIPTSYLMGSTVGINAVDIPGCKERHYT